MNAVDGTRTAAIEGDRGYTKQLRKLASVIKCAVSSVRQYR